MARLFEGFFKAEPEQYIDAALELKPTGNLAVVFESDVGMTTEERAQTLRNLAEMSGVAVENVKFDRGEIHDDGQKVPAEAIILIPAEGTTEEELQCFLQELNRMAAEYKHGNPEPAPPNMNAPECKPMLVS